MRPRGRKNPTKIDLGAARRGHESRTATGACYDSSLLVASESNSRRSDGINCLIRSSSASTQFARVFQ